MYRNRTVDAIRREHAKEREKWAAERTKLIDKIMYLCGRPWEPAPYEMETPIEVVPKLELIHPEELPLD